MSYSDTAKGIKSLDDIHLARLYQLTIQILCKDDETAKALAFYQAYKRLQEEIALDTQGAMERLLSESKVKIL